jgi:glycosyltransferase involved in cell wall biosynthesis
MTEDFLTNRDIVFVTLSEWNGPRRIRHHLALELARRGNRVLFIEAYYTTSKFIRHPDFSKFFQFLRLPQKIQENIFLSSVFPQLPLGEFSGIISWINWTLSGFLIRRAMRSLKFDKSILVAFAYNAGPLIGNLHERLSVYFCNDAFDKLFKNDFLRRKIVTLERKLIKKVDAVITVSEKLTQERSQAAKKIFTIHHGVDIRLFEEALRSHDTPPESIRKVRRPIIGYSGVVRHIIDIDLLDFIACSHPEWSLVIVGPVMESDRNYYRTVDKLKKRNNVYFLGPVSSDEVPRYIGTFDVCLLPYIQDEVSTYYAVPLKFYEYLAAGKAVVSTVGPKDEDEAIVINANTKEEFLSGIERALAKNSDEDIQQRLTVARRNDWSQRVVDMAGFLSTIQERD